MGNKSSFRMSISDDRGLLDNDSQYSDTDKSTFSTDDEGSTLLGEVTEHITLTWENVTVKAPPPKKPLFRRKNYKPLEEPKPIIANSKTATNYLYIFQSNVHASSRHRYAYAHRLDMDPI